MKNLLYITLLILCAGSVHAQKKWTLKECVDYALENNIAIKQAQLDKQTADIGKSDAIGNFLPSINASGSHSWNIGLTQNITTGVLENQTTQNTSVGLSADVTIFNGLQNVNRLHRANLAILASQYQLDDMKDNVSLQVVQGFLQVLFNKETLKVQQLQYDVTKQELDRTKELVDEGVVPKGDLLEIKATAATQEQQIVNAENALRLSKISLAQLLLITDYENFDVSDETYEVQPSTIMSNSAKSIYEKSLEVRNNVKISEANVKLAEYDLKIAEGTKYPSLSGFYRFNTRAAYNDIFSGVIIDPDNPTRVIGTVEGTGQNVLSPNTLTLTEKADAVFEQFSDNKGHSLGVSLSIPILNGFSSRNSIKRNRISVERAKESLEQTKIDLESVVNQAYNDAQGAYKAYDASKKALTSRKEAYRYSQERFNVGLMNSFDFSQAKQRLETAESDLVRTKFDYIFRIKILEYYFGVPFADQ